ncbi:Testis-expressed protein 2 [Eumeta japonica]|uniref:Testis-expressed protein 2 n=1 Tax=Eumeta variegata TaxID=151549 RepID=A0A4C1XNY7_EUMVA|nr:Testis-expressed protein 2 [Eumeta japonica]
MLGRIVYDVMRDPSTISRVQNRIQRKLNTLKIPSFMSPLVVTELSLGGACPLIERVSCPSWDERGVWLDADLKYDGGAYISLLTQINLMKLKEKSLLLDESGTEKTKEQLIESVLNLNATSASCICSDQQLRERKPAIYDSDVEDSAESSSDDETPPLQPVDSGDIVPLTAESSQSTTDGGSSKKKFLRMVDKIATNKYFQQVTDYKYVKRAMEGLSNTDIRLQLELLLLDGRLAINLPPPPHDRVWIGEVRKAIASQKSDKAPGPDGITNEVLKGTLESVVPLLTKFRSNPQLILKARPAVGARALRFAHISNWIEQKLSKEFEKVLVLPNMEDIVIDFMTPTPVQFE